jgi:hypothetical protein
MGYPHLLERGIRIEMEAPAFPLSSTNTALGYSVLTGQSKTSDWAHFKDENVADN